VPKYITRNGLLINESMFKLISPQKWE